MADRRRILATLYPRDWNSECRDTVLEFEVEDGEVVLNIDAGTELAESLSLDQETAWRFLAELVRAIRDSEATE